MDLWPITLRARESLLTTLEEVEGDSWGTASLCDGWTIRELLAHLTLAARPPARRYLPAVFKAGGNFDKANHRLAITDARQSPDQLIAQYRAVAGHQFSPPGWPEAAPLSDILLHSLDARIPLGVESNEPPEHYEPVLDLLFKRAGRSFTSRGRPQARWVATDHEWSAGNGPDVRGSMENLSLTAAGRRARLDHLEGEGVAALRTWLG